MSAVDAEAYPQVEEPSVLRCGAARIEVGDQVAFVSAEDGQVAGAVTGVRTSRDRSTVALVIDNRVHFVPAHHQVAVVRLPRGASGPAAGVPGERR